MVTAVFIGSLSGGILGFFIGRIIASKLFPDSLSE